MEGKVLTQDVGLVFQRHLARRKLIGSLFYGLCLLATFIGVTSLALLLIDILIDGAKWLDWRFITSYPSRHPEQAGIKAAILGTVWVVGLTGLFSFIVGIGTAIYLEEYATQNWLARIIQTNIANLAGVPSIVYGLLGLAVFVQWMNMGRSIIAGALTMTLLVLPIIIVVAQEAIRGVPDTYRQAAYALGATRWQVVRCVVLPTALPGILTGTILAMSRAIGEAAPMIAITALVYITFVPKDPLDRFTVVPIQIFNWISLPQEQFRGLAAAGIIVLLVVLLGMNALAIYLRNKFQRRAEE